MGRLVQVSDSSALQVQLPNGHNYTYGNYVVLSNEEFAVINSASYGTDAILTDRGAFPLVNSVPTGPVVPSLGALDLLNSDTLQVGNALAPARTNLNRYAALTDTTADRVTSDATDLAIAAPEPAPGLPGPQAPHPLA